MRFLVDECTGKSVAHWLREQGHDVYSVYEEARGITDDEVLDKAYRENYILVTNDKDFGEMVHREKRPHRGIVLLRLNDERPECKIQAIENLLTSFSDQLADSFAVVAESQVRISHP